MADNVIEEADNYPGKDELEWGYEEGKDSMRESLANSPLCETWNFIVTPMIRNYSKINAVSVHLKYRYIYILLILSNTQTKLDN